jgi:hypothetical protein
MVLHDLGRGAYDQKLQVSAVEYLTHVPVIQEAVVDGDTIAE